METPRFKYIENEKYLFEVEFCEGTPFLHLQVYKWSPSVLKELYSAVKSLKEILRRLGCTKMRTITPNPKFAKLFGGECVDYFMNAEVIEWDLKH